MKNTYKPIPPNLPRCQNQVTLTTHNNHNPLFGHYYEQLHCFAATDCNCLVQTDVFHYPKLLPLTPPPYFTPLCNFLLQVFRRNLSISDFSLLVVALHIHERYPSSARLR